MNARRLTRALAAFGATALAAGGLTLVGLAVPAAASTGDCSGASPAAALVADGVCEVRITTVGASTFTPPSGIAKLSAVLVGGGAGGVASNLYDVYSGGDGGRVIYVDSVPLSSAIAVTVGGGAAAYNGSASSAPMGGDTTVGSDSASGGAQVGGAQCGFTDDFNGDGARTGAVSTPTCSPGLGYTLSQLSGIDPVLFPSSADTGEVYGSGGAATGSGTQGTTGTVAAIAGTGGSVVSGNAAAGSPGLVVFRFAALVAAPASATATTPTLATTGADVSWPAPVLGAAAVAAGAVLLAAARRRRSSQR